VGGIQRTARHEALTQQQQIFKRHLRIVDTFVVLTVANTMARNLQRLTDSVEMKTNDSRRKPDRWNPAFGCKPAHSRLANLQMLRKLSRR